MLPPWMIDQKRREEESRRRAEAERPRLQLPKDEESPDLRRDEEPKAEQEDQRGSALIDFTV